MVKITQVFFAAALLAFTGGCATTTTSQLAHLEAGESRLGDVESLLGKPVNKSYEDGLEIWEYHFDKTGQKVWRKRRQEQRVTQLVLKVKFDDEVYDGFRVDVEEKIAPPVQPPPAVAPQKTVVPGPPPQKGRSVFKKRDKNNDGRLSRREFPGPEHKFNRLDRNHNGFIEFSEVPADSFLLRKHR